MIELFARLVFHVVLAMVCLGLILTAGLVYAIGLAIVWVVTNGVAFAREVQRREAGRIER